MPKVENAEVTVNGQAPNNELKEEDVEDNVEELMKPKDEEPYACNYGAMDMIFVLVSLITHVLDQVTDIMVAVQLYHRQKYWYFGLTLAFVIVPTIIMTFSVAWRHIKDYRHIRERGRFIQSIIRGVCIFLNLVPVIRYLELLWYGWKLLKKDVKNSQKISRRYRIIVYETTVDVCAMRVIEGFMESAPQSVLQICILVKDENFQTMDYPFKVGLQMLSIGASLVSVSMAIVSYNRSIRSTEENKAKLNWTTSVFEFIWRFFNISSRVLSLALFASVWPLYMVIGALIHWLLMTIWIMMTTHFCNGPWGEMFVDMVMGFVRIFCFIKRDDRPTRYDSSAYHILVFMEGTVIMLTWYLTRDTTLWYHLPALLAFFVTFFIGILLMIIYYRYSHPSLSFKKQAEVSDVNAEPVEQLSQSSPIHVV